MPRTEDARPDDHAARPAPVAHDSLRPSEGGKRSLERGVRRTTIALIVCAGLFLCTLVLMWLAGFRVLVW